jgi:MFS family permease
MRQAFRQPGFTRLYSGLTASMFGDSVMLLALSMWVKTITGSNAMAGLTFFFMVIPALFAPLMGIWIDRIKRRPLLVWGHLASGAGVLPLVLVRGQGQVWIIWAVAVLYGVSFVVLPAALNGLLKELIPEDDLVDANSSLQTTKESFRLFGPLIGALLFTWVGGWAIALLDSASFVVAAVVIASIPVREEEPHVEESQFWSQLTAGLRHLGTDRVLKHVLVGFGITMLVVGFTESAIYALLDAFDKPATFVSVIVSVQGVGAVAGGLATSWVVRRLGEVGTCVLGLLLLVSGIGVMGWTHSLVVVCLSAAWFGSSLPMLVIAFNTLVQRRSPQAIMGRVSTAIEVVMATPQAISLALGSLLVVLLSYREIFAIMSVVTFIAASYIAFWLRHQIRDDVRREHRIDGQCSKEVRTLSAGVPTLEDIS